MRRLDGKVAIVTGAGSIGPGWGNGRAAAVLYAREGASVVLVDRDGEALRETRATIAAEGGSSEAVVADVSTPEGVEEYVQQAIQYFGTIDVLHNNVGIAIIGDTLTFSEKNWDLTYKVNVKSVFLGCQGVIPEMKRRGQGSIVNISSAASLRWSGVPYAAYASSKAAVNQLTQAIAVEYAPNGIRCNAVVVGYVDTPTVAAAYRKSHTFEEGDRASNDVRAAAVPLGRTGTAWDVAHASLFLASDESRFITGTQIVVDGGLTAVCDR